MAQEHDCKDYLHEVEDSKLNEVFYKTQEGYQFYRVYKCTIDGSYWGCLSTFTKDAEEPYDNNWKEFGDKIPEVRHA